LFIFTCLFEGSFYSRMIRFWCFDSISEYSMCFVSGKYFNITFIVYFCFIKCLKITSKLCSNSSRNSSKTCCIVCKSFFTRTILNNNFASQCFIILCTNVVLIITILQLNCAFSYRRFLCCTRFCSLALG